MAVYSGCEAERLGAAREGGGRRRSVSLAIMNREGAVNRHPCGGVPVKGDEGAQARGGREVPRYGDGLRRIGQGTPAGIPANSWPRNLLDFALPDRASFASRILHDGGR